METEKVMQKFYLQREQALLLIIDIQEKLFKAMDNQDRLLHQTNLLVQVARAMNLPVIVTEQNPRGLGPTLDNINLQKMKVKKVKKMTFSAATSELLEELKILGKKQIIIVGIEAHVCVFQTVRDLQKLGYQCYLVADAVDSRTSLNYALAIDMMREIGAVITSAEMVTFDLLHEAGTSEFKEILPWVK